MNLKESSPFTPGNPVPMELFVGRTDQIDALIRFARQSTTGRMENVFLSGDRGIGKSSLAAFLRSYVGVNENMLASHIFLGRVSTLDEMVRQIFDNLLKEAKDHGLLSDVRGLFGSYIKEIGLFGISVSFSPPKQDLKELVRNFPEALNNFIKKIRKHKSGLFIALDDINGLVEKNEFANWYKSVVDEISTNYKGLPVFIMLIGLPEKRKILAERQPSLMRIFRVVDIEKLSDREVEQFFKNAFKSVGMKISRDALKLMVYFSSGLPLLMQEIGDASFWADTDGVIGGDDAAEGVINAARNVGRKYLDPKVYDAIRSRHYRSILRKIGEKRISRNFSRKEIEEILTGEEKKVFNNFLTKMKRLGVIENDPEGGRGAYRFVNEIYPIYIQMESRREKSEEK